MVEIKTLREAEIMAKHPISKFTQSVNLAIATIVFYRTFTPSVALEILDELTRLKNRIAALEKPVVVQYGPVAPGGAV